MTERPIEPAEAFARLGSIKLSETDLDGVLSLVAALAKQTLTGADEVSVTLLRGSDGRTAASTGDLATKLDEWQYERGHGPCIDASMSGDPLAVPDMHAEDRWPDWAAFAAKQGAGSSMSIGLPIQQAVIGALNIYAPEVNAFDQDAVTVAQSFAAYAAVAVANAHLYDSTATLARQMQAAMENRAVIEQAKGIIMGERRCAPDEAFGILAKISQDTNRKVRDVAAALVASAEQRPRP